jgi:hypothetical protein
MKSKRKIVKLLFFVGLVLVFTLSLVSYSEAEKDKPIKIKGSYGVVGQDICVNHWKQNPNPNATYDTHWTSTSTIRGVATFYTDGTGRSDVKKVTITHPIYSPIPSAPFWTAVPNVPLDASSVSVNNISNEFTYGVNPERGMWRIIHTSSGVFVFGTLIGKYVVPESESSLTGFISSDMQTIIESTPINDPIGPRDYTSIVYLCNDVDCTDVYAIQEQTCQKTRTFTLIER